MRNSSLQTSSVCLARDRCFVSVAWCPLAVFACLQWLEDLSSQSGGAQEQQQQQQYAQAALRRLLVNDPCLAATASSPEHITQLLQAGWHVWHTCKVLPAGQVPLPQLRRLWTLLRVLLRLPPDDIRVTRFLVNCKVKGDAGLAWQMSMHSHACEVLPPCCTYVWAC